MDNIDIKIDNIFRKLPNWSETINPEYQLDYHDLISSALIFIESLPEIRERYRFSKQSLKSLKDAGVPLNILERLDKIEESKVYNNEEFMKFLEIKLEKEQIDKYDLLIRKHTEVWRVKLKEYSHKDCFPNFNQAKASALYLFFRVIFQLPSDSPRDKAKVFGGWIHPSIPSVGEEISNFNLSWPVMIKNNQEIIVQRFTGYFGKGYDAIGEYDYFIDNFDFREKEFLKSLTWKKP